MFNLFHVTVWFSFILLLFPSIPTHYIFISTTIISNLKNLSFSIPKNIHQTGTGPKLLIPMRSYLPLRRYNTHSRNGKRNRKEGIVKHRDFEKREKELKKYKIRILFSYCFISTQFRCKSTNYIVVGCCGRTLPFYFSGKRKPTKIRKTFIYLRRDKNVKLREQNEREKGQENHMKARKTENKTPKMKTYGNGLLFTLMAH